MLNVIRYKYIAHAVGVVGTGELGVMLTFVSMVGTLAGAGLSVSGVRSVSLARSEDESAVARVAHALLALGLGLGFVGALLVYGGVSLLGTSSWIDQTVAANAGICALAVLATVGSVTRLALINGLQRVRAFTAVNLVGGTLATALIVAALAFFGRPALAWAVLLPPLCAWGVGWWLTRDVRSIGPGTWAAIRRYARPLLLSGLLFVLGSFVGTATQYASRHLIGEMQGEQALGLFQATWNISLLYIGFVLSAFAADYYPRISGFGGDAEREAEALKAQVLLSIRLVVPVILVAILAAPLAVRLLYSSAFLPMVEMLRWQMAGDVLKVTAWAMSYLLIARGSLLLFAVVEALWCVVYLALLVVLVPRVGLVGAAYGYGIAYAAYMLALLAVVRYVLRVPVPVWLAGLAVGLVAVTSAVAGLPRLGLYGTGAAVVLSLVVGGGLVVDAYRRGLFRRFLSSSAPPAP